MVPVLPAWVSPLLTATAIAFAAALAWAISRPLLREPDGPTLPERMQRWRGQFSFPIVLAVAVACFSGRHALWAIPAIWLISQTIQHRVRRRVFGDTWSLPAQLAWNLRALAGTAGFWWLVALTPLLLAATGAPTAIAIAAGVALLAWNHFYADLVLAALGATPLARPDLDAVFEPVLARARVPRPRVVRAGPPGARVANAFAMSSPRGDVVLFLDTLLETATPGEAAGILAHELGHLEDFATRRGQLYAHGALLALGAAVVPIAVRNAAPELVRWTVLAWFGAAIGSLLIRGLRSQQRETDSDRRAVALCGGDGEALVRALELLCALGRVPRRVAPDHERHATHPSLGKRIRAIRAASGAPPDLIEPCLIAAHEPTRAVIFERERVVFVTSAASIAGRDPADALAAAAQADGAAYADLVEIRVEPGRSAATILVAATRTGVRFRLRIADADVPALQRVLNAVDQRVTPVPPPAPAALGRIAAAVSLVTLLAAGPMLTVIWTALVASVRPAPPILIALAAGMLAAAIEPGVHPSAIQSAAMVLAALVCAAVAVLRWRALQHGDRPFRWDGLLAAQVIVIALAALWPAWWILALGQSSLADLHVAARFWAGGAAGWAALGACLALLPRRLARICSVLAFAAGATIFVLASDAFRDRYAPDPLIADAPPLAIDDLPTAPIATLALDGPFASLELAPGAQRLLLARPGADPGSDRHFVVASLDGWRRAFTARQARFVDAETLLTVRADGRGTRLAAEAVRDGVVRWWAHIDAPVMDAVDVAPSGRWRAIAVAAAARDGALADVTGLAAVEGRIGDTGMQHRPLPAEAPANLASSGASAAGAGIVVRRRVRPPSHSLWWMLSPLSVRSEIVRTGTAHATLARSRLTVECFGPTLSSPAVTCVAQDIDETYVWVGDADRGPLRPVARAPGSLVAFGTDAHAMLVWQDRDLLALRAGEPRAMRLSSRDDCPCPYGAAERDGRFATLATTIDGRTMIALYAPSARR